MTVQSLIDRILSEIPSRMDHTVDTLKSGDPATEISGIVTTFLASTGVLRQAVALGANLVITHEPTYYNHRDDTGWLQGDPVFEAKKRFIEEHGLCIWRFHDYWHRLSPDGILTGMVRTLGWADYQVSPASKIFHIPATSFAALIAQVKARLGIDTLRAAGDPQMKCRSVALLAGSTGGLAQIRALGRDGVDVVMCGESNEWETCEYVRDAAAIGLSAGLIVLGHGYSEEGGMRYLVDWLRERIGDAIPLHHVATGDPFRFQ